MANTYYFGTSEEIADMVDVYLEAATGGYYIYFMNGSTKTYLNVIPRSNDPTKTNIVMQTLAENATPSVYVLNTEHKYVKTACANDEWYLGTYGTNKTISASKTSYISDTSTIGVSQFVAWFATVGEGTTPENPPATSSNSADLNTIGPVQSSGGDSSYSKTFSTTDGWSTVNAAIQCGGPGNANPAFSIVGPDKDTKAVCLNGKVGAAGKITSPTLSGGISKLTVKFAKTFTDNALSATVTVTDLTTNQKYTHVIEGNPEKNTSLTDEWTLETAVSGNFTIEIVNNCPSNNSSSNKDRMTILSIEWLGATSSGNQQTPPAGDPDGTVLTIAEAIAKGSAMEHGSSTDTKYKVTGVIDEITSTQWGNMYIKDANGNRLYVYGFYDITGDIRYDAMTTKPVVGDTVTLLGVIGNHNGAQMKNGCLQELVPGTGTNPENPPVNPENPPASTGYVKVTNAADITTGTYVLVASNGYAPLAYGGGNNAWVTSVEPTVSGNTVTDAKEAVWTLTVSGTSVKITDANGVAIKPKGGNNNGITSGDYNWTWTFENGTVSFAGVDSDTVKLACNTASENKFRAYKLTTISGNTAGYLADFTLYKLAN